MRKNDDDTTAKEKEKEGCISDWLSGGPMGSKGVVLVFRSCVLASRTPSMESTTKTVGNNTGTTILLNKAKNMARRLVAEPHSFSVRPANIMHDVMETFGNTTKYTGQAYVVRHVSDAEVPETAAIEEQGHEPVEHKRDIEDVLNDLSKITLKKHLNIENTTANIKPPEEPPPPECSKDEKKGKKNKGKNKKKTNSLRNSSPPLDSDDSEHLLIKEVDSVKVLESSHMPARILKITYKLVNTETKLLHRLLQAHGLQEATPEAKDFNLMWSGLHPKPDVLRSLSPYQRVNHFPRRTGLLRALLEAHGLVEATQESEDWNFMWANCMIPFDVLQAMQPHQRVNHFPRSYELTRKDKLFKNIEKMQYFRGLKHFDFIPTTFLMPAEFKELCTTHYRTKGPWIVKPAASSRGRGIYIVNTPLLIGGHKCDLRLYVCVTSIDPLLIYLYEEGLVRFATWTLSALLRHLRKQGRNTTALMTAIEDLVVKSVLSSAQTITAAARVFVPNFFNCFDPVSGVPVCSTSLNNNAPYTVVQHNYNLLVHSHVLPHFAHATAAASLTDAPPPHQPDQSMGEGRRAFGLYLTHVLKRVSSFSSELAVAHAGLVLRFLKRASNTLRMPYNMENYVTTFLSDTRSPFCVDLPAAKLSAPPARHTLLKHLACLAPINTRRYRPSDTQSKPEEQSVDSSEPPTFSNSDIVLKDSMKEEKPLTQALKYARS
ncbi:hypothetical protein MSG28_006715 [Choristoneura fumiferana]|uniref:Uncharacterized protein n=2 Tax=Choristoneura fumiferana TaxID=7141 RepID=A0ACC0JKU7_CHOFU|nr:hypothetical protein MSG28_006715 [Choristoneura fumiferana]KAI8424779.1 hypothetical protein MSG28_006715 [Choristoneura fumiferana]